MNKKNWAEQESSDEGEQEPHEEDLVSDDEKEPAKESVNVDESPASTGFIAYATDISFSATRDDIGRSTGNVVFEFLDNHSVDICLKANGNEVFGRRISTSLTARPARQERGGYDNRGDRGGGRGGYNNRDNNRDNRPPREHREHRDPRDSRDHRDGGRRPEFRQERDSRQPQEGRNSSHQDARFGRQTETRQQPRSVPLGSSRPIEKADGAPAEVPSVRPKLVLQPRSLPLETVGQPVVKSSVFGEGHANDIVAYEQKKKAVVKSDPDVGSLNLNAPPVPSSATGSEGAAAPPAATAAEGPSRRNRDNTREGERGGAGGRGERGAGRGGERSSRENKPRGAAAAAAPSVAASSDPSDKQAAPAEGSSESSGAAAGEAQPSSRQSNRERGDKQGARIFNSAVNAAGAGKKQPQQRGDRERKPPRAEKEEQTNKPVELTDEEKFKRAQLTIAKAENAGASKAVKKSTGGFGALLSDDDDDN